MSPVETVGVAGRSGRLRRHEQPVAARVSGASTEREMDSRSHSLARRDRRCDSIYELMYTCTRGEVIALCF
jgi:hypothetical protein